MKARKQNVALFIVPGQIMDTPSASGYYSHKFDFIYAAMARSGWELRVIVDVYTQKPFRRTKYKLYSLKLSFLMKVLEVAVLNPIRILAGGKPLTFLNQLALEKLYGQLISKSAARVVFAIGGSEALVKACRKQGVRSLEVQHGMLGPDDVKLYWPNGIFPDSFLSWDSYSSEVAEQAGMEAITIGHPDSQNRESTSEKTGSHICVSLGKNAEDSEDLWGCFPRRLTEIIDSLIAADVPVLIRLHPTIASQTFTAYRLTRWIFRRFGKVRVDNPLKIPLAQSIGSSFANLTGSSATWFEFALAGKTTFVYDSHWADRFRKHASAIQIWDSKQSPIQLFSADTRIGKAFGFSANLSFFSKNLTSIDQFVVGLSSR
jgi:hypothetical protein